VQKDRRRSGESFYCGFDCWYSQYRYVVCPFLAVSRIICSSGKSTFLPYLLLRLISKREPVVYHRGNGYYVFTSDGVYTPAGGNTLVFLAPKFGRVHALVDANLPSAVSVFSDPTLKLYTVLVSSPREDRIKKYIKARGAVKLIPAPPSLDEAFAV
jgi:hypothetical protein